MLAVISSQIQGGLSRRSWNGLTVYRNIRNVSGLFRIAHVPYEAFLFIVVSVAVYIVNVIDDKFPISHIRAKSKVVLVQVFVDSGLTVTAQLALYLTVITSFFFFLFQNSGD